MSRSHCWDVTTCFRCLFFYATRKSPSVFKRLLQERAVLFWQTKFIRQAKYEGEDVKSKAAEMFQVFTSIQGIQRDSFTICLFLLQDITLQAGFYSVPNPRGPTALSCHSLAFACNGATFSAFFETQQSPAALVRKHVKKLRYVSVQVTFGPVRLQGAFVKGAADFPLRRAG